MSLRIEQISGECYSAWELVLPSFGLAFPSDTYHLLGNSNTFTNAKGVVVDGYAGLPGSVTWDVPLMCT